MTTEEAAQVIESPVHPTEPSAPMDGDAISHFRTAVKAGRPWPLALLEAVGMWTIASEEHEGRTYSYLLQGEAFDWIVLAERLCADIDGLVPTNEKEDLLFGGPLPEEVDDRSFKNLIGSSKHQAVLNFWYGVVVEEALQLAVEEEVRKRHLAKGYADREDLVEEAFTILYQETRTNLARQFLKSKGTPARRSMSLTGLKEFTYWLFKRRVELWDPARVASDTRKGLERLKRLKASTPANRARL